MEQPLRNWNLLSGVGRRWRALYCGLLAAVLAADLRLAAQDTEAEQQNLVHTFVGTSYEARSALKEIRRAMAQEDWSAAASLIQVAIEQHGNVLHPLEEGGFSTTRSICHGLLLSWPELLEEYRLRADHAVEILLERARDAGRDPVGRLQALRSVPDRFLASTRGPEISEDVADGLFERGEIAAACEIWERIALDRIAPREVALRSAYKLAIVARSCDDLPALIRLRRWAQGAGWIPGGQSGALALPRPDGADLEPRRTAGENREETAVQLLRLLSAAAAPDQGAEAGEPPLKYSSREDLVHPIVSWKLEREEVFSSNHRRRWFSETYPTYADLQLFFTDGEPMVTLPRKVLALKGGGEIQTLVPHGEAPAASARNPCRFFSVVDPERGLLFATYMSRREAVGRDPLGALLCFSLERREELWSSESKLRDFDILGNPVLDQDHVFAIASRVTAAEFAAENAEENAEANAAENTGSGDDAGGVIVHQGELYLLAIGREDGRLHWSRFIASEDYSGYQVARGREVRVDIPLLTLRHHLIVAETNLGAIVAIEPMAGRIRWVHCYPKEFSSASPWRSQRTRNRPADPPLFCGELVVVCPSDSNRLVALDIADGRLCWTAQDESFHHLLPAPGGRIIASGQSEAACFSAREGTQLWRTAVVASGRGVLAGDNVYFATEDGLATIHLSDGGAEEVIPWSSESAPDVIDLYRDGNRLYGANRDHITAFGRGYEF